MNLRVIHLIRKVERIDRDLEELDTLLGTLQMDREYSLRLRDSLVDESFRLKQLRQKISAQVIRIPGHFEDFVESTVPTRRGKAELRAVGAATDPQTRPAEPALAPPANIAPREAAAAPEKVAEPPVPPATPAREKPPELVPVERPARRGDKKKPPFLFRFE